VERTVRHPLWMLLLTLLLFKVFSRPVELFL